MQSAPAIYLAYFQRGDQLPPLWMWFLGTLLVIGVLAAASYFRRKT